MKRYKYTEKSINESPDEILFKNGAKLKFDAKSARAFGYLDGQMAVAPDRFLTHRDISDYNGRKGMKYSGRFWFNYKIISFWDYPSPNKLKNVINDINKNNTDFIKIDDSWNIEIIADKDGKYSQNFLNKVKQANLKHNSYDYAMNWGSMTDELGGKSLVIPIKYYTGSEKRSAYDKGKSHFLSPLLKNPKKVWKHPLFKNLKNMSSAEYKHKITRYKYTEKIIKEELNNLSNKKINNGAIKKMKLNENKIKKLIKEEIKKFNEYFSIVNKKMYILYLNAEGLRYKPVGVKLKRANRRMYTINILGKDLNDWLDSNNFIVDDDKYIVDEVETDLNNVYGYIKEIK